MLLHRTLVASASAAALLAGTASAQNAATIIIPDSAVTAAETGPTTGQFSVFLDVNASIDVASFNVRIDPEVDTGIVVGATEATTNPLFPSGTLTVSDTGGEFIRVTGEEAQPISAIVVPGGELRQMFVVNYSVPEGLIGDFDFTLDANETFLFDQNAGVIGASLQNGTLTVLPVPEPASAALLAAGTLLIVRRRRHA